VIDQSVNSLANFLTTALLARALSLADFGVYSLLFAAMLTLNGLVNTVVAEPVRTLGVSGTGHLQRRYAGAVLAIVLAVATLAAAAVALYVACGTGAGYRAALALAAAILVGGVFEVMRALAASRLQWSTVLLGDCTSQGTKLLLLAPLFFRGTLSVEAAFWAVAAGVCGGMAVLYLLGIRPEPPGRGYLLALLRTHFAFGKWLSLEGVVYLLSTQLYLYLIALFVAVSAAGAFNAVQTLVNAVNALWMGITTYSMSAARSVLLAEGPRAWQHWLRRTATWLATSVALLLLLISLNATQLLGMLFKPEYAPYAYLAPVLSCAAVLAVINSMLSVAFRSVNLPQMGFRGKAVSAVVTIVICVPLVRHFGVLGAAAGMVVTQLCWLLVYLWGLRVTSADLAGRIQGIRTDHVRLGAGAAVGEP
jgi:O-antigen/teichoic acid export membrane protein